MGSSKIIFVGAVAVVIGMFGFGIKRAERQSAQIAETHLYQIKAKNLARLALEASIKKLPRNASSLPAQYTGTISEGNSDWEKRIVSSYGYSTSPYLPGAPPAVPPSVTVTAFGIVNTQKVQYAAVLQFVSPPVEPYAKPSGSMWNGWTSSAQCLKLKSLTRTYSTIPDTVAH